MKNVVSKLFSFGHCGFIVLITIHFSLFTFHCSLSAQTTPNPNAEIERKMDEIIGAMNDTKFITNYKDYKNRIEGLGSELKIANNLDAREVGKAKILFAQSKSRFDVVIDQLRRDICNPITRRRMSKSPETYTLNYQKRMDDALSFCNENFVRRADSLLKKDGIDLEPINLVANSLLAIFKLFGFNDKDSNEIAAKYLETNFIEKLWIREWTRLD